jgi:hypothetical protein
VLSGAALLLDGYVGVPPGDSDFADTRVEFFVSDGDPSGYVAQRRRAVALITE